MGVLSRPIRYECRKQSLVMVAKTGNALLDGILSSSHAGGALTIAASEGDFINQAGLGGVVQGYVHYSVSGGLAEDLGIRFGDHSHAFAGNYIFYA